MKAFRLILIIIIIALVALYYQFKTHPEQFHQLMGKLNINSPIFSSHTNSGIYTCPAPADIIKNLNNAGSWQAAKQTWVINFQGWKFTGTSMSFMQAIINTKTNNLTCYYQWPDPKKPGTYLWLTIKWQPNSPKASPVSFGTHWSSEKICNSSYKACAFKTRN